MSTTTFLYLINVLNTFTNVCTGILILSAIALVASFIMSLIAIDGSSYDTTEQEKILTLGKKIRKYAIVFVSISLIGFIFIPNKKEMLIITGLGTSIEYLKQNETAKQLPDKAIIAIDKWLSTEASDSSNNK